ncbi:zinc finger CW-type PWWP domain protein 1 [Trichonephila inaurata madagascariensis]|uniref:Zinc finger CW-type PWWP domain protein 1 n=1 Tax=Trichonephila inaurata madagascariensis TaxID=2747483 RepID=A0A8X6WU67_9ARAC|nr:zinc finger CW-type PWWP domain protein 1 [Trichonephila inaurata madagascariensis]
MNAMNIKKKKVHFKKLKETTRDRNLMWINYYSSKDFGIWIECTKCKKWRKNIQYSESHEVPESWDCSMLNLENGKRGSCDNPEEEAEDEYLEYCPGSVVWAKLQGYPWWPGMVDENPDVEEFEWKEEKIRYYNVTFLDDRPTHAWIPETFICPFLKPPRRERNSVLRCKKDKYAHAVLKAKERAEEAIKMSIKDRLKNFSFVHLYKGHWPCADNFEINDSIDDKKGNITDILLKEVDDLDSLISSDTDNEKIETDFNEKEKNQFTNKKIMSNSFNTLNSVPEKYNIKYLSNKDFIPKDKAVFPSLKQNSEKSTFEIKKADSIKNHLDSAVCGKNDFQSHLSNKIEGVKRSKNKKLANKKLKSIKNMQMLPTNNNLLVENADPKISNSETGTSLIPNESESHQKNGFDMKKFKDKNLKTKDKIISILNEKSTKLGGKLNTEKAFNQNETCVTSNNLPKNREQKVVMELVEPIEKSNDELEVSGDSPVASKEKESNQNNEFSDLKKSKKSFIINNHMPKEKSVKTGSKVGKSILVNKNKIIEALDKFQEGKAIRKTMMETSECPKELNIDPVILEENITMNAPYIASNAEISQHIEESISEVIKQNNTNIETTSVKNLNKTIMTAARKNVNKTKRSNDNFSVPSKNNSASFEEVSQKSKMDVDKDLKKETNMVKSLPQTLKEIDNYPMKIKPSFKQPSKTSKQICETEAKINRSLVETKKEQKREREFEMNASPKENNKDSCLLEKEANAKEICINKPMKSPISKHLINESKEKISEISIDDNDSTTQNKPNVKVTKDEEDFFYVTISDDELDCEISSA